MFHERNPEPELVENKSDYFPFNRSSKVGMEGGKDLNLVEKKGGSHHNDTVIQIAADTEEAPVSKDISETTPSLIQ